MRSSGWVLAAIALGFAIMLFYLTLDSAPPSPPSGVEHSAADAERACRIELRDSVREPVFPFSATASYLGDSRYHLAGTIDATVAGEGVRRNYDCWVRYVGSGAYRTDSITLWQSH